MFITSRVVWIKTEHASLSKLLLPLIFEGELIQVFQSSLFT